MLLDMNGEACQVTTAIVIGAPVLFLTLSARFQT
jgi:hypothetical protein